MRIRQWCWASSLGVLFVLILSSHSNNIRMSRPIVSSYREKESSSPMSGTASCTGRSCHGGLQPANDFRVHQDEYTTWLTRDPHARAFEVLLPKKENVRAATVALNLGIVPHEDGRCLACHVNPLVVGTDGKPLQPEEWQSGVGCESCHGAARKWLGPHTAPALWKKLTVPEKEAAYGLVDLGNLAKRAQVCAGCHVGAPGRDVNHELIAAGHPRLNFEFGAYLANMPHHWKATKQTQGPDHDAKVWAIGQVASASAASVLLADRSTRKTASWPEFAEYDCFACHHDLMETSWRQARRLGGSRAGTLPWNHWYFSMPWFFADPALPQDRVPRDFLSKVEALRGFMEMPNPQRRKVADAALAARDRAADLLRSLEKEGFRHADLDRLIRSISPDIVESSWEAAAQVYLALAAGNAFPPDQKASDWLDILEFPLHFDSPKYHQPTKISHLLKGLRRE